MEESFSFNIDEDRLIDWRIRGRDIDVQQSTQSFDDFVQKKLEKIVRAGRSHLFAECVENRIFAAPVSGWEAECSRLRLPQARAGFLLLAPGNHQFH